MDGVALQVVVDAAVGGSRTIARYTEQLVRGLVETAPDGCRVDGLAPALSPMDRDALESRLPGIGSLLHVRPSHDRIAAAWQHGRALPSPAMVHAPTLLAPLRRHDRREFRSVQTAVTIHDAAPWHGDRGRTDPGAWERAMAERARRFADAIVVPSHAVAAELAEHVDFGDRVRVIGAAPSTRFALPGPQHAEAIRQGLALPPEYLVTVGTLEPRKGLQTLLDAIAHRDAPDLPLVVVGAAPRDGATLEEAVVRAGLPATQVQRVDDLDDGRVAAVLGGAIAFVTASTSEGFGLGMLEAMSLGLPVVHGEVPALIELADGAGVVVANRPADEQAEGYARALADLLGDDERRDRLGVLAEDRSRAFDWRTIGAQVWQLHADL